MPSVSFLGTGSGLPSADRFFSSSLLLLEGKHLLIDAGEPCVHLLRDRGGLIREIDAVLLTHGHVEEPHGHAGVDRPHDIRWPCVLQFRGREDLREPQALGAEHSQE